MRSALANFQTLPLKDAARQLLATLGYKSDKFLVGAGSRPQDFLADFATGHPFDEAKALVPEWKSADLLFQLTDQELSRESSLFTDDSVQRGLLKSYIFIAIELKGSEYARGKFSAIARQINRLFPMPVMVIFKHGDRLTIAVINRRRNKLDDSKDVLEKATLIRDISLANPHRGHLDILSSLALENLHHSSFKLHPCFDTLHAAWEQIFNVELLNERFYHELANWYFWALPQVEFPADLEPDDEKRRATGLIRLLTRLIFCWFLKEKNLIPEKLFHPNDLAKLLKGFDPESETSSTYYQAILQNLFFATLNQRMGKDGNGKPYRFFATDEGFQKNRATYDVNNLYRYESLFAVSQEEALALFADIPFLNGGLFECLDRTEDGTDKKRYLDGFSRNAKERPHVPDRLFFDSGETADLSEVYGDKKRKSECVTGLISILNRYKFTIVENTPIDQEIALDPELLGKVFENLLASYTEETKTTARKQTGSFYTPRPIVDYMVDESLKAHLERVVQASSLSPSPPSKQNTCATLPFFNPNAEIERTERNLPHWNQQGVMYFVTFRLADSLPKAKLEQLQQEREIWLTHHSEPFSDADSAEYHRLFSDRIELWLDAGAGSCCLAEPKLAEIVGNALRHFDGERYQLDEWVVMPNHVHVLLTPLGEHKLEEILHSWKSFTATAINKARQQTGQFWQHESYDHIVRSEIQLAHFRKYIQENPAKANISVAQRSASFQLAPTPCKQDACATLRSRLDQLFTYTEEPHQFSDSEVATLITAIDEVKILDPACGSGAFPMGVLHKLVYILGKLDPDNDRWKQTQLAKLDSAPMREELERAFADNNDDYGRKLYLIENCLYGVDIQPIAIQITKLRFFISLVCDQKTNRNKKDNHGIRPLPNLETKFVAADTLIGLPISDKDLFIESLIAPIEKEIEDAYHSHFTIQRRDQKLALQKKIKALRYKLADTLAGSLGAVNSKKAKHLAEWDPFDPQSSADFFDPHWMFGRALAEGFDIVVGNPPYGAEFSADFRASARSTYETAVGELDSYTLFVERCAKTLAPSGVLSFILPDTWLTLISAETFRRWILTKTELAQLALLNGLVFQAAVVDTMLLFLKRCEPTETSRTRIVVAQKDVVVSDVSELPVASSVNQLVWLTSAQAQIKAFVTPELESLIAKAHAEAVRLDALLDYRAGCKPYEEGKGIPPQTSETLEVKPFTSGTRKGKEWLPLLRGNDVQRYAVLCKKPEWISYGKWLAAPRTMAVFSGPRLLIQAIRNPSLKKRIVAAWTDETFITRINVYSLLQKPGHEVDLLAVLAILNSQFMNWMLMKDYGLHTYVITGVLALPIKQQAIQGSDATTLRHLAKRIISAKKKDATADTTALEREIDQQVYALYGLTPEEIAIVEGGGKV